MPTPAEWIPFEWPATWKDAPLARLLEASPVNCLLAPPEMRTHLGAHFTCPDIAWHKSEEIDWRKPGPVVALSDAVWPQIASRGDGVSAGPTGVPWLDANGWLVRMAHALAPGVPVWLRSDPPEQPSTADYQLAYSEAAAHGAHWPIRLAPALAAGVARGSSEAIDTFNSILAAARWHAMRAAWSAWPPAARLLIVSDFAGANRLNASEVLNLAARRNLAFRASTPGSLPLAGVEAVIYIDEQPPAPDLLKQLDRFTAAGGLLVGLKRACSAIQPAAPSAQHHPRFTLYTHGRGHLALAGDWGDQYVLVQDTHLLMSRRNDAIRLFNAGSLMTYETQSPGRRLVHLLNYARRPAAHPVSLQTALRLKAAHIHVLGEASKPLDLRRVGRQTELYLPKFPVYAAVEMEMEPHA